MVAAEDALDEAGEIVEYALGLDRLLLIDKFPHIGDRQVLATGLVKALC